LQMSNDEYLTV